MGQPGFQRWHHAGMSLITVTHPATSPLNPAAATKRSARTLPSMHRAQLANLHKRETTQEEEEEEESLYVSERVRFSINQWVSVVSVCVHGHIHMRAPEHLVPYDRVDGPLFLFFSSLLDFISWLQNQSNPIYSVLHPRRESFTPTLISVSFNSAPYLHLPPIFS